ncbi:TetR/AcrR family transcriptional regulator [Petropleomorpha daqingensis]|uniref:AcrR family transcriptional regulator n=1 Tax=Petropleomorpha daqingensis TaxID=2026353 RepID=A0A853CF32_9ACTN|nr:TetR/AcrR family transcriptional regulator [Petropleomorpha daqingensis]NYJ05776.1 AcrR family transcriptional regulator [Petropleomorpha daqingensis]
MTAPGRRAYRSPRRQQQAAETRAGVLAAATALFGTRGWSATGMRDVAREAGVAVETVYANFRSKTELLMAAIDVGVVGDADPVPLAQRPEFARLSAGELADRITAAAHLMTDINRRISGLRRALAEAAGSEPELAAKLLQAENRRRVNVRQGVELVTGRDVGEDLRDEIWAMSGVDVFHLLTEIAGWSVAKYERWVADVLGRLLVPGEEGRR